MQAQAEGSIPSRRVRPVQRLDLVAAALQDVAHLELAHARRHGRRTASAQRGDRDAALHRAA